MLMLTRRLQVLVEPSQYDSLEREAARRGVSVGEVVRIGIDLICDPNRQARAEAVERLFAMPPLDLPDDPDELEAELDAMYDA
jgi:hypothetical protein